jgi:hypothetical protein
MNIRSVERDIRRLVSTEIRRRTGTVTLTANAASTVLTDDRIGYDSAILLQPTTANAAAALATTYISETGRVNGAVTITHANNAQSDKTFRYWVG